MANEFLQKLGTTIEWTDGGTNDLAITSVASNGARQGTKVDLGALHAEQYEVFLTYESGTAPVAGGAIEIYFNESSSATAGTDNVAGTDGTDSAYRAGDEDEWKVQLKPAGALIVTADGSTIMRQNIGKISFGKRYASPVMVNKTSQTASATTTNHKLELVPIISELQ